MRKKSANVSFREFLKLKRLCHTTMRQVIPGCPRHVGRDPKLKLLFAVLLHTMREVYRAHKIKPYQTRVSSVVVARQQCTALCKQWMAEQLFGMNADFLPHIDTGFEDLDNEALDPTELLPTGIPEVDQSPER